MLTRLSAAGGGPDPAYCDQLNHRAIAGVPAERHAVIAYDEVRGNYGDGTAHTLVRPRYNFITLPMVRSTVRSSARAWRRR